MHYFMTQVYTNIIFRNKIGIPTILGQRNPRHSENVWAEMCYLCRRTRHGQSPVNPRDRQSPCVTGTICATKMGDTRVASRLRAVLSR